MKMVSISGIVCYVKNTAKTAEFYEKLGFTFTKREPDHVGVRLNWFWIDFHPQSKEDKPEFKAETTMEPKGTGQFLYIKVEGLDDLYQQLQSKGITAASKPQDWPWGNREFVVRDPDGYKIVFFQPIESKS